MKVLHITDSDMIGGASIAGVRLHTALRKVGIDSSILVNRKLGRDENVKVIENYAHAYYIRKNIDLLPFKVLRRKIPVTWSSNWLPNPLLKRKIKKVGPDVIHLHWVGNGLLPTQYFNWFKVPIIWSLHDIAPLTGGCHYPGGCINYKYLCGDCKYLKHPNVDDISRYNAVRKKRYYENSSLHLVGLSNWITGIAKTSAITSGLKHYTIPNVLDTSIFKPRDKINSKINLNLKPDTKYILFGADNLVSNNRKGFDLFIESICHLSNLRYEHKLSLLLFGRISEDAKNNILPKLPVKIECLGEISSEEKMADIYNSSSVFVTTAREDNLPNTILEASNCGVPTVAFNIGGIPDLIVDGVNGYLAVPFDTKAIAQNILKALSNEAIISPLNNNINIVEKWCAFYKNICESK